MNDVFRVAVDPVFPVAGAGFDPATATSAVEGAPATAAGGAGAGAGAGATDTAATSPAALPLWKQVYQFTAPPKAAAPATNVKKVAVAPKATKGKPAPAAAKKPAAAADHAAATLDVVATAVTPSPAAAATIVAKENIVPAQA